MTQQKRSQATRARILQAAETCFARQGFDATGVAEICRRAGVGKGGFYYHFPSKQSVFLELLNRWLADLDTELAARQAGAETAAQRLIAMAAVMPEISRAAAGKLPLFLEFLAQSVRHPAVWKATIAPFQRYRGFFARLVEAGIGEGSLRPVDSTAAARTIVSLAVGELLQDLLETKGRQAGQGALDSLRLLLGGLER